MSDNSFSFPNYVFHKNIYNIYIILNIYYDLDLKMATDTTYLILLQHAKLICFAMKCPCCEADCFAVKFCYEVPVL